LEIQNYFKIDERNLIESIFDENCTQKLVKIKMIEKFIKNIHDYLILTESNKYKKFMKGDKNK
jgi:hypothetical protein